MDRYILNFVAGPSIIQKSYIVFCNNSLEVAAIIAKAERAGYKLTSVARLSNVYDIRKFLELLELPPNNEGTGGSDLLFGNKE